MYQKKSMTGQRSKVEQIKEFAEVKSASRNKNQNFTSMMKCHQALTTAASKKTLSVKSIKLSVASNGKTKKNNPEEIQELR